MSDKKKKKLIKILNEANHKYLKKHPLSKKGITAYWLRNYLKKNTEFKEYDYVKIWGSFTEFKKEINYDRSSFDIIKDDSDKKIKRKYFITSIIPDANGASIDEEFFKSIESYCKHNKAELILLSMRGVNLKDVYGSEIYDKYGKYFATEYIFNSNLKAMDFILNPQSMIPTTGIDRVGKKQFSIISASPKQFMQTIPGRKNALPHIIYTTGTMCEPKYKKTRNGILAEQDQLLGGLVVEVIDDSLFNIRNIVADEDKGFNDLNKYYSPDDKPIEMNIEAMVLGDLHYGSEDQQALDATYKMAKLMKPEAVMLHDLFDGLSVNPFNEDNMLDKLKRKEHQKTLENELNYLGEKLKELLDETKVKNIYVIPSNHDNFLDKYISSRRFINDEYNIVLSCKLFVAAVENKGSIIEYYLKDIKKYDFDNIHFLNPDDSFEYKGIEFNVHGHRGANGAKGSTRSLAKIYSKVIAGHSHTPEIFRDVYKVGCLCKLDQPYNKGQGLSWLHGNCIVHKNGTRQMILIIDGRWSIDNDERE